MFLRNGANRAGNGGRGIQGAGSGILFGLGVSGCVVEVVVKGFVVLGFFLCFLGFSLVLYW